MLTVTELREIPGPEGAEWRVVLVDDGLPNIEGVFLLRTRATERDAAFEVRSFSVVASVSGPAPRINALLLRAVPFGSWLAVAIAAAGDLRDGRDTAIWTVADPRPMLRVEPRVVGAPDYESVARIYRLALRDASGSTAEGVASVYDVSPRHASLWIARARQLGLLGPGAPREAIERDHAVGQRNAAENGPRRTRS